MMKKVVLFLLLILIGATAMRHKYGGKVVRLDYPKDWQKPNYNFKKKPLTDSVIQLGRKLFYDPILSFDSTVSCASCHLSYTAFTHVDHDLSHGINDLIGERNSPVLINLAWNKHFMWDGSINHIEVQPLAPISHPAEMNESIDNVLKKLNRSKYYKMRFKNAFDADSITTKDFLMALTQFQLILVSDNSKYDKMKRGEVEFSSQEKRGYQLFQNHCASCHTEPLFTNGEFKSNGLAVDTTLNDWGRLRVSRLSEDSLLFKVPTLRNIEFSGPYMHDGRFRSLYDVMDHYAHFTKSSGVLSEELADLPKLSLNQKIDLVAFLMTLTDRDFLYNPEFAYPRVYRK